MQKLNQHRKPPATEPPLDPSDLLRLDNVIKHQPVPRALSALAASKTFTVTGAVGDLHLQDALRKIRSQTDTATWALNGRFKVIRGEPFVARHRLRPGEVPASPTLPLPPPSEPDWADRIYHPKLAPRSRVPVMRRKNGKRLRPYFVWGQDARQPFFPQGYPWQCIGNLLVYDNPYSFVPSWTATGALVGPNVVLTAAHAVPWSADPAMIQFIPAYYNGVSTLGDSISSYISDAATYDESLSDLTASPAFDFAVLRLQDRMGDYLGYFGAKTYDSGWNDGNYWTLVGYPGDVASGQEPSFQSGISFHDDDEDSNDHGEAMELETEDGDASPGDSGGPMFGTWDDGPYIVGVLVGGETEYFFWPFSAEDNNVASAGPTLTQLIQWARTNW
jgi:hypothetical protein